MPHCSMEYACTTCCKQKRRDKQLLPAIERYVSRRIRLVLTESRRHHKPLLILSGRFGLLEPDERIPWYDQALLPEAVDALVPKVADQLVTRRASALLFYARPSKTRGWQPYYDVLEKACRRVNIRLTVRTLRGRSAH